MLALGYKADGSRLAVVSFPYLLGLIVSAYVIQITKNPLLGFSRQGAVVARLVLISVLRPIRAQSKGSAHCRLTCRPMTLGWDGPNACDCPPFSPHLCWTCVISSERAWKVLEGGPGERGRWDQQFAFGSSRECSLGGPANRVNGAQEGIIPMRPSGEWITFTQRRLQAGAGGVLPC